MLTGKPPLGHLGVLAAIFNTGNQPIKLELPESVSNEAKTFIEAALTWLVLLIAGRKSRLFSYKMYVKKLCLKACKRTNAGVTEVKLQWSKVRSEGSVNKFVLLFL